MSAEKPKLTWEEADRIIDAATVEVRDDAAPPAELTVTVGILSFRHAATIRQSVESVLAQETDFPFEIVIADDCSDDGTVEIIEALQREHPDRIRLLLARENLGRHTGNGRLNFIRLWRANRGRYFHLLDGDDWWTDTGKLAKQVGFLEHHPDCTLCWHRGRVIYDDDVPAEGRLLEEIFPPGEFAEENDLDALLWANRCLTSSVLYRRGICDTLPDEFLHVRIGDWPLQILHARAGKAGFIDEIMSAYRFHAAGMWSGKPVFDQVIGFFQVMAEIHGWIPETWRERYSAELGRLLGHHFAMDQPAPLGANPSRSLAIVQEILRVPGVEEAFAEKLEERRRERVAVAEKREAKIAGLREKVNEQKAKIEELRSKKRKAEADRKRGKGWFNRGA